MTLFKIFKYLATYCLLFILIEGFYFEKASAEIMTRLSVNAQGMSGNSHSHSPAISADGRYIAFQSDANNLVPNDNNSFTDIFLYERFTKHIKRVSVSSNGTEANFVSFFPALSANGRYIVFQSDAYNLVQNDTNNTTDIFIHDREMASTQLVSMNSKNELGNSTSSEPSISAEGRYIAFHSYATNLVKGDTNKRVDVFVQDRQTREVTRVSVTSEGKEAEGASFGAMISANGRYVVFTSDVTHFVNGDTNQATDVFVHDRATGVTQCVSVNSAGELGNADSFDPVVSAAGRYVAFGSRATNLVPDDTNEVEDIFLHDRETGETVRVSLDSSGQQAESASFDAALSAEGRYVLFNSDADNLIPDDDNHTTDVLSYDRETGQVRRFSLASQFYPEQRASNYSSAISQNGRWVVFESQAWNLVGNDFNEASDIFLYDRAYYATLDIPTGQLVIPVFLTWPDERLLKASFSFVSNSTPIQFTLNQVNSFRIPLQEVYSTYQRETGLLYLPGVDILISPEERLLCEFEMLYDPEKTVFTLTQINCL
jgi:Tol biopolymer transport system component